MVTFISGITLSISLFCGLDILFVLYATIYEYMYVYTHTHTHTLIQFPARVIWSVLGQDSLFHIASVYPAAKWVPRIDKRMPRACALYAASCSGISPGRLKWFRVYRPARGGRLCEHFGGYKTINRIPLPLDRSIDRYTEQAAILAHLFDD